MNRGRRFGRAKCDLLRSPEQACAAGDEGRIFMEAARLRDEMFVLQKKLEEMKK